MAQQQDGRRPSDAYQYRNQAYGQYPQMPQAGQSRLTPAQRRQRVRRKQEILRRRRRRRRTLMGLLVLLIIAGLFVVIKVAGRSDGDTVETLDVLDLGDVDEEAEETLYDGPPVAEIAFVGDISTSADQVRAVTRADGTYDFSAAFADVSGYLSSTAYTVGTFESTIVDGLGYGGEPYYNSPMELAGTLRTLGFRLVSTAGTYALNNGVEGVISTKNYLTEAGLKVVGTYLSQEERDENRGVYVRNIHKIRFAFLAYTKGTDSVTMPEGCEYALNTMYSEYSDYWTDLKSSTIRADVQAAKDAGAEVIIALVHWGSEYGRTIRDPQKEVAELLLENGVDVIIGAHSHLVSEMGFQEVEQEDGSVKNCFVAYGLGDFYTDPDQPSAQESVILNLEFSRGDDGTVSITNASYTPVYMNITQEDGVRTFAILDVYKNLADLKRNSMTSQQAELFNNLLTTLSDLHEYIGEDLDVGAADEDKRIVERAIEEGPVSAGKIKELKAAEKEAAKEAAETAAEADETAESEDSAEE